MGALTKFVEGKLSQRNIIPMGQDEKGKRYPNNTPVRKIVVDMDMDPSRTEVLADGEELDMDDQIGDAKDIQILPKQKGGFGEVFQQAGNVIRRAYRFVMKVVFLGSFAKDVMLILAVAAALMLGVPTLWAVFIAIAVSGLMNLVGYNAVT